MVWISYLSAACDFVLCLCVCVWGSPFLTQFTYYLHAFLLLHCYDLCYDYVRGVCLVDGG